jgi:plasmid stability protein
VASLTIRNLEESLKSRLRVQAATHGRSMEEEARALLRAALSSEDRETKGLGSAIHALFREFDGLEVVAQLREPMREPPSFE